MIMTVLKQSTRYYLDEKEYEVATCYADMYCKMILQYMNKKDQAVAALRDLAYEFYILGHYRSAKKFYLCIKEHYGWGVLKDDDLAHLAEAEEKLGCYDAALSEYQRLLQSYPKSSFVGHSYRQMSHIWNSCCNSRKVRQLHDLAVKSKAHKKIKRPINAPA